MVVSPQLDRSVIAGLSEVTNYYSNPGYEYLNVAVVVRVIINSRFGAPDLEHPSRAVSAVIRRKSPNGINLEIREGAGAACRNSKMRATPAGGESIANFWWKADCRHRESQRP